MRQDSEKSIWGAIAPPNGLNRSWHGAGPASRFQQHLITTKRKLRGKACEAILYSANQAATVFMTVGPEAVTAA